MNRVKEYYVGWATLSAPLIPALVMVARSILAKTTGFFEFIPHFLYIYFFSFSLTLAIGLPFYLLLNYFDLIRWWTTVIAGCAGGVLLTFALEYGLPGYRDFAFYCSLSILASFTFWFVWRYHNPNTEA